MRIGLDFDNTIVCYDGLFHAVAQAEKLIPLHLSANKTSVRDHLRSVGREQEWTRLQGLVYGEHIAAALPFPGVLEFLKESCRRGIETHIVSHRTRRPIIGPDLDLHRAARDWIARRLVDGDERLLPPQRVHLEETKAAKIRRIAELNVDVFVDDLPEFLNEADFPANVVRLLFDPRRERQSRSDTLRRAASWAELGEICFRLQENAL